ncbi:MAG TPA: ATP-binding protein [Opitutus sp.]|nr:ATP-binding protein [Opitutus sp.]
MSSVATASPLLSETERRVASERFSAARRELHAANDRFFAKFMIVQWLATVVLAAIVTPRTWAGRESSVHVHLWAAVFLGGIITAYPVWLGLRQPGHTSTRHIIAAAQMLMSALLIDITGGRIETHFHVFGSLAFLAFYRDVRVLITATIVVYLDHLLRGIFWPESVYGVLFATPWRSVEHAFWVLFEVTFLTITIRGGLKEMRQIIGRQIALERSNQLKEQEVRDRTSDLAASEERFRSFFRDSPIGLYRADAAGEFQAANPALLAMLGLSPAQEVSAAGLHDADRRQFLADLARTDSVVSRDAVWHRHDGSLVQVRERARAFREAGRIVRIDGTVEDVSERRQLEERYLQSQKVQAIGQLAGGVAHDFNNILTAIMGYCEMLLSDGSLGGDTRRAAQQIRSAGDRAASLTHQLLAFSRKQRLQPRVLQLATVVTEMGHMLQRLVGEHIRIRTISTSGLAAVRADPGQLQQVVMNLVVNARDAMPQGGQLTIETANAHLDDNYARLHPDVAPGRYAMLAVSDTGCGMTPEVKARIFEPFFTTKPLGTGTGLGLATCHGIVKQSGGHIAVYSEAGHGTTFKIYLPAIDTEPAADGPVRPLAEFQGAGETVLLVEDEADVRELGDRMLTRLGYRVLVAANGVEALAVFEKNPRIDVLVTDVVMPDVGGSDLAQRLRPLAPDLRVLFTSGYTFDALGQTDLIDPHVAFLSKPYDSAHLGASLHALLHPDSAAPGAEPDPAI